MDSLIEHDWFASKNVPDDELQNFGNAARSWQWRETGMDPPNSPSNRDVLENVAEDILVQKRLKIRCCDLPGYPRSTFLMVFSPDGTKVASTHGNHNIYISELSSGKHVRILKGHPRTPWCIAFHPSHTELIGSGCLGGQVRVWALSGGSETWTVDTETVIASIAFHPRHQLLVIATLNELYFWDWSQPKPFTKVSTNNFHEKVRYVAFDSLGYKLITGISYWSAGGVIHNVHQSTAPQSQNLQASNVRREAAQENATNRPRVESPGSTQDMIVNSYQHLVQRYDNLVRNYRRLFMARHQLSNSPPTNTMDRGTDPMETDFTSNATGTSQTTSSSGLNSTMGSGSSELIGPGLSHTMSSGTSQATGSGSSQSMGTRLIPTMRNFRLLSRRRRGFPLRNYELPIETETNPTSEDSAPSQVTLSPGPTETIGFVPTLAAMASGHSQSAMGFGYNPPPRMRNTSILGQATTTPRPSQNQTRRDPVNIDGNGFVWYDTFGIDRPRRVRRGDIDVSAGLNFLNMTDLIYNANPSTSRAQDSVQPEGPSDANTTERPIFGSRTSAFQPLRDNSDQRNRNIELPNDNEQATRLLPNPFSPTTGISRSYRLSNIPQTSESLNNSAGSSRTSAFVSQRRDSPPARFFLHRRRNATLILQQGRNVRSTSTTTTAPTDTGSRPADNVANRNNPSTSTAQSPMNSASQPHMYNQSSSTSQSNTTVDATSQICPLAAQTINESLDLIRDILRDSGNRLLNLITNVSLSNLVSSEWRRSNLSQSDDGEGTARTRYRRPRIRLFSSSLRRELLSSGSDSDSDQTVELNIYRTRNNSFSDESTESINRSRPDSGRTNNPLDRLVLNVNLDARENGEMSHEIAEEHRINIVSNSSIARTHSDSLPEPSNTGDHTDRSNNERSTNDAQSRQNVPSDTYDRPSTSRDDQWMEDPLSLPDDSPRERLSSEETYRRVRSAIISLQRHTAMLSDMWIRGRFTSLRNLREMWENLRRRVLSLHRRTGQSDIASYYTRSFMDRCRMLSETTSNSQYNNSNLSNSGKASKRNNTNAPNNADEDCAASSSNGNSAAAECAPSTSTASSGDVNRPVTSTVKGRRVKPMRHPARRRSQPPYRWISSEDMRRRTLNMLNLPSSRWGRGRASAHSRRDNIRSVELNCTRNEIRLRAMQVLSKMFDMMMSCLDERGLSHQIILMLRTLKKALSVTCLLLAAHRIRREPVSHTNNQEDETVNVDDSESVQQNRTSNANITLDNDTNSNQDSQDAQHNFMEDHNYANSSSPMTSDSDDGIVVKTKNDENLQKNSSSNNNQFSGNSSRSSRNWSNRLAVQISAANRNFSSTARTRRESYLEGRRLKALHRCNPTAHPLIKKRVVPPSSTHRIPTIRSVPSRLAAPNRPLINQDVDMTDEPVPGPSNTAPVNSQGTRNLSRSELLNEFEHRINLFRIAHIHALRVRHAARNRFRRLHSIRVYSPAALQEMLSHANEEEPAASQQQSNNGADTSSGRPIPAAYRAHILQARRDLGVTDNVRRFEYMLNNVAVPLVQVNDVPVNDGQRNQGQGLHGIYEYLQPIVLAQNILVDDMGEAGLGAGDGSAGETAAAAGGGAAGSGTAGGGTASGGMAGAGSSGTAAGSEGAGDGTGSGAAGVSSVAADASSMAAAMRAGVVAGGILDAVDPLPTPSHRVQAWVFTVANLPDISDGEKNVVVQRCKIHNDASIDISKDGRLLVALLPIARMRAITHRIGVYSLEWGRLGQCLYTAALEHSAVSVALSPTARHLAVGLGSRRFTTHARNNVFALILKLTPMENPNRTLLVPVKELKQDWEQGFTSLNCLRWAPQPGQGLVYANNTGQLIIMS